MKTNIGSELVILQQNSDYSQMPGTSKMAIGYAAQNVSKTTETAAGDESQRHRLDEVTTAFSATAIEFDGTSTTIESSPFIRSYNVPDVVAPSKLSRLSLAIRRSLRLGPRRPKTEETPPQPGIVVPEEQLPPFTDFTDLRPEIFVHPSYGSKEDLLNLLSPKHIRQLKNFLRENNWPVSHEIRRDLWRVLVSNGDKEFDSSRHFFHEHIDTLFRGKGKTAALFPRRHKGMGQKIKQKLMGIPIISNAKLFHFRIFRSPLSPNPKIGSTTLSAQNFRPAFLSEPGIVVCDHGLKQVGVINLQRLLIVIEYAKPEIRFVPVLYPLCAVFLHYHSPDDTFACVSRLLSQGNRFVLQSELAVFASRYTILALLKKFKKKIFNKLKRRLGTEEAKMADVFANWYFWIFKHLPLPYLIRVMDCFLVEGQKMLARAALTILYLWSKQQDEPHKLKMMANSTPTATPKAPPLGAAANSPLGGRTTAGPLEDQQIFDISTEISDVACRMPISVQTFLDIGFSIRRFGNSFLYRKQRHYEAKFRNLVARQRAQKNARQVDDRIYTPAFSSQIVDEEVARELMGALPARFQLETPTLLFRLSEHGTSFVQFWTRLDEADQSILIIRTTDNHIFGAYLSSTWAERKDLRERTKTRYFGTGESFVWRLDDELKLPVFYTWCDQTCDNFFMTAGDKYMLIGSGGGDAIAIRDELVAGSSRPSTTFQSPELVPGGQYQIDELEAFGISSVN